MREFYEHVTGWSAARVSKGNHKDYCLVPAVESVRRCAERGGKARVAERRIAGMGRHCVTEDPAAGGAALYQAE